MLGYTANGGSHSLSDVLFDIQCYVCYLYIRRKRIWLELVEKEGWGHDQVSVRQDGSFQ